MRSTSFIAVFFVASVVACSSSSTGAGGGQGEGGGGGGGAVGSAPTGAGTCESACAYYLQCKSADTADNRALCNQRCAAQGYTSQQLADFQRLECAAAVAAIEGGGNGGGGNGGGGNGGGGADCNGCAWDGSACIYLVGGGGNYVPCDSSCCK